MGSGWIGMSGGSIGGGCEIWWGCCRGFTPWLFGSLPAVGLGLEQTVQDRGQADKGQGWGYSAFSLLASSLSGNCFLTESARKIYYLRRNIEMPMAIKPARLFSIDC
jgi:hypothetical protein